MFRTSVKILLCTALVTTGCAGASVSTIRTDLQVGALAKPDLIVIKPVDASKTVFQGDYSDDPPSVETARKQLHDTFAQQSVQMLKTEGYNAQILTDGAQPDPNAAVVQLNVKIFEAGSNAARMMVGMGAGASYLLTDVTIQKAGKTIADFTIDANSGARGGFNALGSFLKVHIDDSVRILVDYLKKKIR